MEIHTYDDNDTVPEWATPIAEHTRATPAIGFTLVIGAAEGEGLTAATFVGPEAGLTDLTAFARILAEVSRHLAAAGLAADVLAKISTGGKS